MKPTIQKIKQLIALDILRVNELPGNKGAQIVFFGKKGLYAWRDEERVYLQGKHFWNKKYAFSMEEIK